jgi:hypothetical protein
LIQLGILCVVTTSLIIQLILFRKMRSRCIQLNCNPPKLYVWSFIEYVWSKSKKPSYETLKPLVYFFLFCFFTIASLGLAVGKIANVKKR